MRLTSPLQLIKERLVQQGPDLCLGLVLINADSDNEILINHFAYDKNHPDIRFSVYMNAITPDAEERLPKQLDREQSVFEQQTKMLRAGQARIEEMDPDEAFMRFEAKDTVMSVFVARSIRSTPSLSAPSTSIRLNTGGEISSVSQPDLLQYGPNGNLPQRYSVSRTVISSLSHNEAIGLWDAIVQSARLRPNAVRNTP